MAPTVGFGCSDSCVYTEHKHAFTAQGKANLVLLSAYPKTLLRAPAGAAELGPGREPRGQTIPPAEPRQGRKKRRPRYSDRHLAATIPLSRRDGSPETLLEVGTGNLWGSKAIHNDVLFRRTDGVPFHGARAWTVVKCFGFHVIDPWKRKANASTKTSATGRFAVGPARLFVT